MNMTAPESKYKVEVDSVDQKAWDNIVGEFEDAVIFQTWSYGAVRWGHGNLSHLVLRREDVPVAGAQARIMRLPLIGAGIAYITWGPLWRARGLPRDPEVFRRMIRALREEYVVRRGLLLQVHPMEWDNGKAELAQVLIEEKMHYCSSHAPYRTLIIDLSHPVEELRRRISPTARRSLRKAEQHHLKVKEGFGPELFEQFLLMYKEMERRKGFPDLMGVDKFGAIQEDLPEGFKMKILICEYEGKPVAADVVAAIGERGVGILRATTPDGRRLLGAYLLNWLVIVALKEQGCRYFDFSGYDPQSHPDTALYKKKWGGVECSHLGRFEACDSLLSSLYVQGGEFLRDNCRALKRLVARTRASGIFQRGNPGLGEKRVSSK